ncbi:MAG: DUF362 domain-containing protein [Candidatus Firestonebacteria bacterium]
MLNKKLNRKEFIKKTLKIATLLYVEGIFHDKLSVNKLFAEEKPFDLAVVRNSNPESLVNEAIKTLGGIERFVKKGDIVLVKPNIGWNKAPKYAATTNPDVVSTVIKLCYKAGAKKVKVFDRTCDNAKMCYKNSGIEKATRDAGGEILFVEERNKKKWSKIKLDGIDLKNWPVYDELLNSDSIINVPIAKHHGSSTLTLGMKNWMGVVGGNRGAFHLNLHQRIADISTFIKPKLIIVDAVRILTAHGPKGGNLADVKNMDTIMAGVDQVAVDSCASTLFGMKGEDIDHIKIAYEMKIGEINLSKLKIKEMDLAWR